MIHLVYFSDGGAPKTSLTLAWSYLLKVSDGLAYAQPSFSEVGGGWYKFDLTPTEDVVGVIDGSAALGAFDRYAPFSSFLTEGLAVSALLKRLTVIFGGNVTRAGDVLTFKDIAAATETTHTLSSTGRVVS